MLVLRGPKSGYAVYALAFSPDGASLVSYSRDRTVRLWDLREVRQRIIGSTDAWLWYSVAFSPDGRTLAWTNRLGLHFYDVDTSDITELPGKYGGFQNFSDVSFSPNGRTIAATGGAVFLWDRETRRLLDVWGSGHNRALAFIPDGRTLAVGRRRHDLPNSRYGYEVVLYDLETKQMGTSLSVKRYVNDLTFAPNGRILAAVCGELLMVWDISTQQPIFQHKSGKRYFQGVAFSPDGCLLAAAHNDRTVRLWRTSDWREHAAFDWGIGEVLCIAFSPDGMTAAAGGRSGRIVLWDVDL
jgi:WD40 repeat protein